jgi:chromosomal replication initiation ATPase DnaA
MDALEIEEARVGLRPWPAEYGRKPTLETVCRAVISRHPGVTVGDIRSGWRYKRIVHVRHEFYYIAAAMGLCSLTEIARWAGCDHSSVIYGVHRHAARHGLPAFGTMSDSVRAKVARAGLTDTPLEGESAGR